MLIVSLVDSLCYPAYCTDPRYVILADALPSSLMAVRHIIPDTPIISHTQSPSLVRLRCTFDRLVRNHQTRLVHVFIVIQG